MGFLSICRRLVIQQPVFVAQAYFFLQHSLHSGIAHIILPIKIGNAELFGNLLHAAVKSLRVVAFNRSAFCPLQSCNDSARDSAPCLHLLTSLRGTRSRGYLTSSKMHMSYQRARAHNGHCFSRHYALLYGWHSDRLRNLHLPPGAA